VDRWKPGGPVPSELTENFAYLPFGGGRRKCIGTFMAVHVHIIRELHTLDDMQEWVLYVSVPCALLEGLNDHI